MSETWWVSAKDLNEEQEAVVRISGDGNYLVTGPPGSGKTNALMLRAEYLNRKGNKNYQVLVFTRALKEFLAACPAPYAIPPGKLKTLSGWLMESINTFNGTVSTTGQFGTDRARNVATLRALVDERGAGTLVDSLLLDEAQDFTEAEVDLFRRVARNIYAVADARQQIYNDGGGLTELRKFCEEMPLTYHYRNGRAICRIADHVGSRWSGYAPMLPASMYNETDMPSSSDHAKYASIDKQIKAIIESIEVQLEAYPTGVLGVMAPKREDVDAISAAFRTCDFWKVTVVQNGDEAIAFKPDTRVCVCTVHSGKGLEFRTVHIAGADKFSRFREAQWRMLYTAVTRSKTKLSVYHSASVPAFLEAALAAGEEHDENPTLDDLFS